MTDAAFPLATERQGPLHYLRAIRRRSKLIVLLVAIAVAVAAAYSFTATKRYESSGDLLIQPLSPNDEDYQGFSLFRETFDDAAAVVTAARLINSREISRQIFDRLGRDANGASVVVEPLGQANIVTITATAPDAKQAARVANAYASGAVRARTELFQTELTERVDRLEQQIARIPPGDREGNFEYAALQQRLANYKSLLGMPDPTIVKLTTASPPSSPSWPRPLLSIVVAFMAALLLGVGIVMLLDVADPRIASEDELLLEQRLPILARIPRLPKDVARDYLTGRGAMPSGVWKAYALLRAVIATLGPDGSFPRSVLVTSASPGDGKTTTAVNLAITLASSNMDVILVDCDLHRPMIATVFNVPARRGGVADVLFGKGSPQAQLVAAPAHPRLRLLLAGRHDGLSVRIDRERVRQMIERLLELCDVVVIDSPPLPDVPEVLDMAEVADSVLLTVRLGRTKRETLFRSRELLARRGVSPSGFVVTTRESASRDDAYGYRGGPVSEAPPVELDTAEDGALVAHGSRRRTLSLGSTEQ